MNIDSVFRLFLQKQSVQIDNLWNQYFITNTLTMCVNPNALGDMFIYPDERAHELSQNKLKKDTAIPGSPWGKELFLLAVAVALSLRIGGECFSLCLYDPVYVVFSLRPKRRWQQY